MEYYELLGLEREPFADTANPYFLYASPDHDDCLSRLEIAIRLGRGLALVLGDVGTGKTTMALSLEQNLRADGRFHVGAIYDPAFMGEEELLDHVFLALGVERPDEASVPRRLEVLREFLVGKAEAEGQSVVLILDESQKLSPKNLELLRLLLNNQRPDRRLFNVVLFGQLELLPAVEQNVALKDRINLLYVIRPLQCEQTHALIDYRLRQAGGEATADLFSAAAKDRIHEASGGHPRKIILLCQEAIQESFVHETSQIDVPIVEAVLDRRRGVEDFIASYLATVAPQSRIFDPREHAYVERPTSPEEKLPVLEDGDSQGSEPVRASLPEPPPGSEGKASPEHPLALETAQAAADLAPTLTPAGAAAAVTSAAAEKTVVASEAVATTEPVKETSPLPSTPPGKGPMATPTPTVSSQAPKPPARRGFWQWLFGS